MTRLARPTAAELVALILAVSIALSLLMVTAFALFVALHADAPDASRIIAVTQVLTGWGGGMLGVLGAYIGYSFGAKKHHDD